MYMRQLTAKLIGPMGKIYMKLHYLFVFEFIIAVYINQKVYACSNPLAIERTI